MRVALVGNGRTTRESDGFDGDIWTTASVSKILPRVDCVFEMHNEYDADNLNGLACPVFMDGEHPEVELCYDMDVDDLVGRYGYMFQFSFDYMMAHAIDLEVDEIYLYGIDLTTDTEYEQFRQSFFYWIGYARGMGIRVIVSDGSLILNHRWVYPRTDGVTESAGRYANIASKKLDEWEMKEEEARMNIAYSRGYKQCAVDIMRQGV